MARRIVIAGAGGFGREVYSWLSTSPKYLAENEIEQIAFINDDPPQRPIPAPMLSSISDFRPGKLDLLICAIGQVAGRRAVTESLEARDAVFATFAHDSVIKGLNVSIGEGSLICPGTVLTTDIEIGSHVQVNINCSIGHDVSIADFATVSPACSIMGGATLERGVFLGTGVIIAPGRTVHQESTIGAGSVVIKDIEANVVAFGSPCKVMSEAGSAS